MGLFETSLLLGLVSGVLYALSAAGLVLIYRSSGVLSFAQGDIAAVGLFVAYAVYQAGAPYPVVALITIVASGVVGLVVGTFGVIPFERRGVLIAGLATIGIGIFIQGAENATVGSTPRAFPAVSDATAFSVHEVQLQTAQIVQLVTAVVLFLGMGLAFKRLSSGIALRAVNEDAEAADMMGIPGRRLTHLSWLAAGALAGVAGLFIVPIYTLTPTSVNAIILFGFCAVVVGGVDSLLGALVGGVLIGVATNFVAAYLTPNLVAASMYLVLLAVLLVRPHGLLGRAPLRRV